VGEFLSSNRRVNRPLNAYFSDGRVEANLPVPGELEAGLEYWPAEKVMLAIDACPGVDSSLEDTGA